MKLVAPKSWALPVPNDVIKAGSATIQEPIESEAVNEADRQHKEHKQARNDWSDPGKNHGEIDEWDN